MSATTAVHATLRNVPVRGGALAVGCWEPPGGGAAPVVVAVHGITSSHAFWGLIGPALAERGVRVLAPDLRGRGLSAGLPGPSSIAGHADDLVALLDAVEVPRAVVAGHSMGAFVTAATATRAADRVAAALLVDGGPPLVDPPPAEDRVEEVLHAIIGPSLDRLRQVFPSPEAYRAFWRAHPSFADVPGWLVDAYADHDLVAADGGYRSRVVEGRIVEDARDTLSDPEVGLACGRIAVPAAMLVAERGMLDGPAGLYDVGAVGERFPSLSPRLVPGTNHFSIGMAPDGAAAVVEAVLALVAAGG